MTGVGVQSLAGFPPSAGGALVRLGALARHGPGRGPVLDEYRFASSDLPLAPHDGAAVASGFLFVGTTKVPLPFRPDVQL